MNNDGQDIFIGGIYRPGLPRRSGVKAGAWPFGDARATEIHPFSFAPDGALAIFTFYPRLSPWAIFDRRSTA